MTAAPMPLRAYRAIGTSGPRTDRSSKSAVMRWSGSTWPTPRSGTGWRAYPRSGTPLGHRTSLIPGSHDADDEIARVRCVDQGILVILTGPPGAGKSTIGRLVAAEYNPSACIHSDWAYTTIVNGFIRQWEPESDPQNQAVIRSSIAMAARLVEGGYFTVIEGIFGPWYLHLVQDELDGHQIRPHYVVLRPDIEKCLERAQNRPQVAKVPRHLDRTTPAGGIRWWPAMGTGPI